MTSRPDFAERLLAGIELFNSRRFWHAHEAWEELWLVSRSEARPFLQGLIQLAAAYHHVQRGTLSGAGRLFEAALTKLKPYPASYCGIERDTLVTAARHHHRWTSLQIRRGASLSGVEGPHDLEYPRIRLTTDWRTRIPPAEEW